MKRSSLFANPPVLTLGVGTVIFGALGALIGFTLSISLVKPGEEWMYAKAGFRSDAGVPTVQGLPDPRPLGSSQTLQRIRKLYADTADLALHWPARCENLDQNPDVSIYVKKQCVVLSGRFQLGIALSLLPLFVISWLIGSYVRGVLRTYSRAHARLNPGQGGRGTVTRPSLPSSLFGFFFGLRPIQVRMEDRSLRRIYLSGDDATRLDSNTQVLVHSVGKVWGVERFVGMTHQPHVAVVKGTRRA